MHPPVATGGSGTMLSKSRLGRSTTTRHRMHLKLPFVLPLLFLGSTAHADPVDDAYRLCKAMEGTGMTTECTVSGYHSRVDATIDTNGAEARKVCTGIAEQMSRAGANFKGKWQLRILSPYSGEKAIAVCALR
jgi:hypothetical protein